MRGYWFQHLLLNSRYFSTLNRIVPKLVLVLTPFFGTRKILALRFFHEKILLEFFFFTRNKYWCDYSYFKFRTKYTFVLYWHEQSNGFFLYSYTTNWLPIQMRPAPNSNNRKRHAKVFLIMLRNRTPNGSDFKWKHFMENLLQLNARKSHKNVKTIVIDIKIDLFYATNNCFSLKSEFNLFFSYNWLRFKKCFKGNLSYVFNITSMHCNRLFPIQRLNTCS